MKQKLVVTHNQKWGNRGKPYCLRTYDGLSKSRKSLPPIYNYYPRGKATSAESGDKMFGLGLPGTTYPLFMNAAHSCKYSIISVIGSC